MTLTDYQKEALKTADERNTLEYCVLGLANEAGEVSGVVKKWLRRDYDEAVMREKMLGELGDVLWYVAVTADRVKESRMGKVSFADFSEFGYLSLNESDRDHMSLIAYLCYGCSKCLCARDDFDAIRGLLPGVLASIANMAWITGHTLEDVATHNIEKLRDRQERGVLYGSGDER